MKTKTS